MKNNTKRLLVAMLLVVLSMVLLAMPNKVYASEKTDVDTVEIVNVYAPEKMGEEREAYKFTATVSGTYKDMVTIDWEEWAHQGNVNGEIGPYDFYTSDSSYNDKLYADTYTWKGNTNYKYSQYYEAGMYGYEENYWGIKLTLTDEAYENYQFTDKTTLRVNNNNASSYLNVIVEEEGKSARFELAYVFDVEDTSPKYDWKYNDKATDKTITLDLTNGKTNTLTENNGIGENSMLYMLIGMSLNPDADVTYFGLAAEERDMASEGIFYIETKESAEEALFSAKETSNGIVITPVAESDSAKNVTIIKQYTMTWGEGESYKPQILTKIDNNTETNTTTYYYDEYNNIYFNIKYGTVAEEETTDNKQEEETTEPSKAEETTNKEEQATDSSKEENTSKEDEKEATESSKEETSNPTTGDETVVGDVKSADTAVAEEANKLVEKIKAGAEVEGISEELASKITNAIKEGKDVKVDLSTPAIEEEKVAEDAAKVKELIGTNSNVAGYFDINLFVSVEGETAGKITKLEDGIKVTLPIPSDIPAVEAGYTRTYTVVRVHNGVAEELETTSADGNVTFETDSFSTYALTYKDVKNTSNPKTSDDVGMYVTLFAVATLGIIAIRKRK